MIDPYEHKYMLQILLFCCKITLKNLNMPNYAKDMPKICHMYAKDMLNICQIYANDMPKIC